MFHMRSGRVAAALASGAVLLAALAAVWGITRAANGEWSLLLAPLVGFLVTVAVFRALQRLCRGGGLRFGVAAAGGIGLVLVLAAVGASFGGIPLLAPG